MGTRISFAELEFSVGHCRSSLVPKVPLKYGINQRTLIEEHNKQNARNLFLCNFYQLHLFFKSKISTQKPLNICDFREKPRTCFQCFLQSEHSVDKMWPINYLINVIWKHWSPCRLLRGREVEGSMLSKEAYEPAFAAPPDSAGNHTHEVFQYVRKQITE